MGCSISENPAIRKQIGWDFLKFHPIPACGYTPACRVLLAISPWSQRSITLIA